jgi:hypothetical protein
MLAEKMQEEVKAENFDNAWFGILFRNYADIEALLNKIKTDLTANALWLQPSFFQQVITDNFDTWLEKWEKNELFKILDDLLLLKSKEIIDLSLQKTLDAVIANKMNFNELPYTLQVALTNKLQDDMQKEFTPEELKDYFGKLPSSLKIILTENIQGELIADTDYSRKWFPVLFNNSADIHALINKIKTDETFETLWLQSSLFQELINHNFDNWLAEWKNEDFFTILDQIFSLGNAKVKISDLFLQKVLDAEKAEKIEKVYSSLSKLPSEIQVTLAGKIYKKIHENLATFSPDIDEDTISHNSTTAKSCLRIFTDNFDMWQESWEEKDFAIVTKDIFLFGNEEFTNSFLGKLFTLEKTGKLKIFEQENGASPFFNFLCEEVGVYAVYHYFLKNLDKLSPENILFLIKTYPIEFMTTCHNLKKTSEIFEKLIIELSDHKKSIQKIVELYNQLTDRESKKHLVQSLKDILDKLETKLLKSELSIEKYTDYLTLLSQFDSTDPLIFESITNSIKRVLTLLQTPKQPEEPKNEEEEKTYKILISSWSKNTARVEQYNLRKQEIAEGIKKNQVFSKILAECLSKFQNSSEGPQAPMDKVFIELCKKTADGQDSLFRQNYAAISSQHITTRTNVNRPDSIGLGQSTSPNSQELNSATSRGTPSPLTHPSIDRVPSFVLGSPNSMFGGKHHHSPPDSPESSRTKSTKGMSEDDNLSRRSSPEFVAQVSQLIEEAPRAGENLTVRNPIEEIKKATISKRIPENHAVDSSMIIIETLVVDILNARMWNGKKKAATSFESLSKKKDSEGNVPINYTTYYQCFSVAGYSGSSKETYEKVDKKIKESRARIGTLLDSRQDINSKPFIDQLGKEIRLVITFALQGAFTKECEKWALILGDLSLNDPGLSYQNRTILFAETACLDRFVLLRNALDQKTARINSAREAISNNECCELAKEYSALVSCWEDMIEKYPNTPFLSSKMSIEVNNLKSLIDNIIDQSYEEKTSIIPGWNKPSGKPVLQEVNASSLSSISSGNSAQEIMDRQDKRKALKVEIANAKHPSYRK